MTAFHLSWRSLSSWGFASCPRVPLIGHSRPCVLMVVTYYHRSHDIYCLQAQVWPAKKSGLAWLAYPLGLSSLSVNSLQKKKTIGRSRAVTSPSGGKGLTSLEALKRPLTCGGFHKLLFRQTRYRLAAPPHFLTIQNPFPRWVDTPDCTHLGTSSPAEVCRLTAGNTQI
jgi:hypothetical protein